MKKIKEKVLKLNLKKAIITYIIAGIVFVVIAAAAGYATLGKQFEDAEKSGKQTEEITKETDQKTDEKDNENDQANIQKQDGENGDSEHDGGEYDFESMLDISGPAEIVLGIIAALIGIFGVIYWLLCIAWAVQKSEKMGTRTSFWAVMTLFFNLGAIILLYLYGIFRGTCPACGQIRSKGDRYCSKCGIPFVMKCESCDTDNSVEATYCKNCGTKI